MEYWIPEDACTGCAGCDNICPKAAISMVGDDQGFPHPIINQSLCVDCDACRKVCPVLQVMEDRPSPVPVKWSEPRVYAAWSRDRETRYHSTSGGVFSELARVLMAEGGFVSGASYDANCVVHHEVVADEEGLERIRQSKYVQSEIGSTYREIRRLLRKGKTVFFCGAPCQVAGLYGFLKKEPKNLITADFICRGVNSPLAYRSWLDDLESEYGAKATRVWFKNKELGWNTFSTRVDFANGRKYRKSRYEDTFMPAYLEKNLFIRPSCTRCEFKGLPRQGDITLADFWGIEKTLDEDLGTSMVIVNSAKRADLLKKVEDRIVVHERSFEEALSGNGMLTGSARLGALSKPFLSCLRMALRTG